MQKPWPILLLARELGSGGCERDLTKAALGLDRSRFEVHVGCFRSSGFRGDELRAAGIPIVQFQVNSLLNSSAIKGARALGRYVREHGILLSHAYDYPMNLFATPVARWYGVPVVIASQLSHRDLRDARTRLLLRICDRLARRIVVNCKALERHLIADFGVPADRIFLCYNGVDTSVFYPIPHPDGARPEEKTTLVIGSVCVLRPEKRMDLLLEAFGQVRNLRAGLKLVIVGSGPLLGDLLERRDRLGLGESCHFEPATSEIGKWLRSMDIFAIPSSSEAFSNALLEAMACGCAPVGSRVGGTPELIADGERGLLFESGNVQDLAKQLAILIEQDERRNRYARAAAAFARESLTLERFTTTMGGLYSDLLEAVHN